METWDDMDKILSQGITHIMNLQIGCDTQAWYFSEMRTKYPDIEFLHLYFVDDRAEKPAWIWDTLLAYAKAVLKDPRNKIYLHCALGESRSPATVYLILRVLFGKSESGASESLKKNYFNPLRIDEEKYKDYIAGIETYIKGETE